MGWDKAIKKVLSGAKGQMHYKEIAEEIEKQGLRSKFGATPANTVFAVITRSISNEEADSDFIKVSPGYFALKASLAERQHIDDVSEQTVEEKPTGLIQCFGMYWQASEIVWKNKPKVLGQQQAGADLIDFSEQVGVYVLYDRDRVIYVGRTTDRAIGQRLFEHTKGRMNGRWDRFSWFGLRGVDDAGKLLPVSLNANNQSVLIETLESILIEVLEPPQNRKRGDQFSATEYLQAEDPEKDKLKKEAMAAVFSSLFGTTK